MKTSYGIYLMALMAFPFANPQVESCSYGLLFRIVIRMICGCVFQPNDCYHCAGGFTVRRALLHGEFGDLKSQHTASYLSRTNKLHQIPGFLLVNASVQQSRGHQADLSTYIKLSTHVGALLNARPSQPCDNYVCIFAETKC